MELRLRSNRNYWGWMELGLGSNAIARGGVDVRLETNTWTGAEVKVLTTRKG